MFGKWSQVVHYDEKGVGICKHQRRWHGCPDCRLERKGNEMKKWRSNNPEKLLRQQVRQYGVTLEWYVEKQVAQNDCCAICGKPESQMRNGKIKRLAVDHDHDTGQARDLLCTRCNQDLGVFENTEWRRKAELYLQKHRN